MKKLVSAPYLLWMAIFIIVPLIMVAYFALTDTNGAFTLDNLAAVSQYSNELSFENVRMDDTFGQ